MVAVTVLGVSSAPAAFVGAWCGLGAAIVVAGALGRRVLPRPRRATAGTSVDGIVVRAGVGAGAGVVVFLATGWPVAAAFAAGIGVWLPSAVTAAGRTSAEIAKVDALATWTEQLRDTLSAASGLESAIVATSRLAPVAIRDEVERLGARVEYERTTDALRRFADEVHHPVADFVVAALVVASENQARDLAPLLGQLAGAARAESRMRTRVWVGRARTRTVVRVTVAVVPLMVAAVMLLDPHYFDPYATPAGQVVLLGIGLVFLAAFVSMERMARISLPERFVGRVPGSAS